MAQGTPATTCQPQNGGNPNAAVGSYIGAGPLVNYANVTRVHEDDSLLVKYYDAHGLGGNGISKMAFSLTWDCGLRVRRRRALHAWAEQGGISRRDALRPDLVPQRPVRRDGWRRLHEQSGPLSGAHSADQRCDRRERLPVLHSAARTEALSVGFAAQFPVHAERLDYLVDRSHVPSFETFRTGREKAASRPPAAITALPASCVGGGASAVTGQCDAGDWFPDLRTREVVGRRSHGRNSEMRRGVRRQRTFHANCSVRSRICDTGELRSSGVL